MDKQGLCSRMTYRVIYGDLDAMGIVYYANYLRLFERGRGHLIRSRGLPYREIENRGFALPVTEAYCHYHRSAQYDDLLLIDTEITQIRRASMRFEYEIFKQDDDDSTPLATGHTIHACINQDNRIVRVPDFIVNTLTGSKQQS